MTHLEALAWLRGERSMTNVIPQDPQETWLVRIAQADAAMTEQAYWIARAHGECRVVAADVAGTCPKCGGDIHRRPGRPGEYDHDCTAPAEGQDTEENNELL